MTIYLKNCLISLKNSNKYHANPLSLTESHVKREVNNKYETNHNKSLIATHTNTGTQTQLPVLLN